MKANTQTLFRVLQAVATNHNATIKTVFIFDKEEEFPIGCQIDVCNVPTLMDVKMVAEAFFGSTENVLGDDYFGTIYVDYNAVPFLDEADEMQMMFALRHGQLEEIKKQIKS